MNKVFKVIWNEARNAYVVVSEIAKNHGSKSCSTKKLLAMLIATGVMTCASFDVLAAPVMPIAEPAATKTAAQQYVALKAKEFDKRPLYGTADRKEYDAQQDGKKQIGDYTYKYDPTNKYWVREGYVLTVDKNGGKYTPLSDNAIRADVAYTKDGVAEGILQSVTSTVEANGTVTNMGESLNKVTAGSFAGVSHSGGTEVAGSWNYIIEDSSWQGHGNYRDGYVNLFNGDNATAPKGFVNTESIYLKWDDSRQAYFYKNQRVDYSNMYVINGKLGVFTDFGGDKVYTGTVYGSNNEILMTVKDNGKFYSYWAASVTDPTATMETYPVSKYNNDMAVLEENEKKLYRNDIKEVTMTTDGNGATISLLRNGKDEAGTPVKGAIKVTSGGGTGGSGAAHDTFVKISNGTTEQTFATGSKVEAIVDNGATTGIKINGEAYTIKSGSVVSVAQNDKTTTITVDGTATTITDTDTKYTAGNGIAIDKNNKNAISVQLKEGEKNLVVDSNGLALNTALTGIQSIKGTGTDAGSISFEGSNVKVNKNTFNSDGRIQGVAAGVADTDAVNVSQLNKVSVEAGKHTTLVAGDNVTLVENKTDKGLEYTVTAKDTTYSAGDNVAIDKDNKISVDLSKYAKTEDVAVVYDKNNGSLKSTNATSVGSNAIALGKGAEAGNLGTVLGDQAKSNRQGATLVGYNANSAGLYSTVVGTDAVINTDGTAYKAKVDTVFGTIEQDVIVQGAAATVVGSKNTVDNQNKKVYSGVANNIMGAANTIEGSNGITIQGSGNKVTDAYKDMNITSDEGLAILGGDYSVLAKKESGAVAVVGGANTVSKQTDSTVIGFGNKLTSDKEKGSQNVFMAGSHNELKNVSDSIVMGNKNKISDKINVISFGHENAITANNAVAIGNGAGVSVEGGVALGVGSVADRAAGEVGYDPAIGAKYVIPEDDAASYVWKATKGAVSVGRARETRQITNVAAGTEDTDAVNVAQLKKVSEAAANANQGWKLKTTGGTESVVAPGATVEFDGDANIQVGNVGNKVNFKLNKDLTGMESITGAGGGSISFADGSIKFNNKVTIDNNGKITGVANGEITADSTDAVNGSQLYDVKNSINNDINNKTFGLKDDNGTEVTNTLGNTVQVKGANGITSTVSEGALEIGLKLQENSNLVVNDSGLALNTALTGIQSITGVGNGSISFADGGIKFNNKVTIDNTGKISGVADGKISADSTDAVNGSQLNAVKETANKGWKLKTKNGNASDVKPGDEVEFDGDDNIKVSNDGNKVSFKLNNNLTGMESITGAGGGIISFAKDSKNVTINNITFNNDGRIQGVADGKEKTDAVNLGQLDAVKSDMQASDKHLVVNAKSDDGSYKPNAKGDISLRVEDQNKNGYDVVIKDVASKAELGEVANRVTTVENKVTQIEKDVTNIKTDITNINTRVDKVEALAGKHTTLEKNGTNINVEETVVNGQKNYKVNLNKDITLGDKDGNNVSISGTDGTITATGDITTANRINADKGGKLADIDVTGNKLSNGNSSITLDGTNVKVNDKVTVDKDGKISGVAKGDISNTSTDAVNGSQLYDTNTHITNVENQVISNSNRINQLGNRVNKVGAGAAALAALHPMDFDPDDKLTFSAGYGNYGGENAAAIGAYYRPDEKVMFSVGGTVGNGENMVNAGVSFALDRTNHVSNSRTAMAREILDLRAEVNELKALVAKGGLGTIEEDKMKIFPDVAENHWAYEYIGKLAAAGIVEGYPDGNFNGDRMMSRYEFAAMLYRAMQKGAQLDSKIINEFAPEMGRIRVDRISGEDGDRDKIERVRVNAVKGERDHYGNKIAK